MEIFLVRHAETDFTRDKRYCSVTDISLNEAGVQQALNLRDKLEILAADVIFCSTYKRTQQTAQILFPQQEIALAPALAELDFGEWEGLRYEELMSQCPREYGNWLRDPYKYRPPGGEKMSELEERTVGFLRDIFQHDAGKRIFCVSHAGPIKTMVCWLMHKERKDFWDLSIDLASVSYFKIKDREMIAYNLNQL